MTNLRTIVFIVGLFVIFGFLLTQSTNVIQTISSDQVENSTIWNQTHGGLETLGVANDIFPILGMVAGGSIFIVLMIVFLRKATN
tara:strand:+ start:656 stop:910 length:255 start_codon:yes stop_codon:yes gene_type:complete